MGTANAEVTIGQPSSLAITDSTVAIGDVSGALLRCGWPDGSDAVRVRAHDDRGPLTAAPGGFVTAGGWDTTVRRWDTIGGEPLWSERPVNGRVTAVHWASDARDDQGVVLAAGADRAKDAENGDPDRGTSDRVLLDRSQVFALHQSGSSAVIIEGRGEISSLTGGPGWWAAVDRVDSAANRPARPSLRLIVADVEHAAAWVHGAVLAVSGHAHILAVATARQVWRYDVSADRGVVIGEIGADDPQILALAIAGDAVIGLTSEGLVRFPGGHRFGHGRTQPVAVTSSGDDFLVLWPDGVVEQRTAGGSVRSALTARVQV